MYLLLVAAAPCLGFGLPLLMEDWGFAPSKLRVVRAFAALLLACAALCIVLAFHA